MVPFLRVPSEGAAGDAARRAGEARPAARVVAVRRRVDVRHPTDEVQRLHELLRAAVAGLEGGEHGGERVLGARQVHAHLALREAESARARRPLVVLAHAQHRCNTHAHGTLYFRVTWELVEVLAICIHVPLLFSYGQGNRHVLG